MTVMQHLTAVRAEKEELCQQLEYGNTLRQDLFSAVTETAAVKMDLDKAKKQVATVRSDPPGRGSTAALALAVRGGTRCTLHGTPARSQPTP